MQDITQIEWITEPIIWEIEPIIWKPFELSFD
jgi:hypothetical protein